MHLALSSVGRRPSGEYNHVLISGYDRRAGPRQGGRGREVLDETLARDLRVGKREREPGPLRCENMSTALDAIHPNERTNVAPPGTVSGGI